jgi:hypothetical protein
VVPLNIRCSKKCATPDWPTGSSAAPTRYQSMCVTTGARLIRHHDDLHAVVEREAARTPGANALAGTDCSVKDMDEITSASGSGQLAKRKGSGGGGLA